MWTIPQECLTHIVYIHASPIPDTFHTLNTATIKSSMDSPQDCVEATQNSEVRGGAKIVGLLRSTGLSCLSAVPGALWKLESMQIHIHAY